MILLGTTKPQIHTHLLIPGNMQSDPLVLGKEGQLISQGKYFLEYD